jgi:transposase
LEPLFELLKEQIQTDGYEAYETALKGREDIVHVGCFAHARRKFVEASKGSKKTGSVQEGLKRIQKIYAIERELRARELQDDEFLAQRQQQVQPILEDLKAWLEKKAEQVPPQTLIGKAVHYTLGQWEKLIRYLEHPLLTPDNNAAENAIRPFVLGRKNWLFSGSPAGAESSCGMYSLIETAKQNGLSPYFYLFQVFEKTPLLQNNADWQSLLPWNIASS